MFHYWAPGRHFPAMADNKNCKRKGKKFIVWCYSRAIPVPHFSFHRKYLLLLPLLEHFAVRKKWEKKFLYIFFEQAMYVQHNKDHLDLNSIQKFDIWCVTWEETCSSFCCYINGSFFWAFGLKTDLLNLQNYCRRLQLRNGIRDMFNGIS